MIPYKAVGMFSHLKQQRSSSSSSSLVPLASAFRLFEANSPPKPATKSSVGAPRFLYLTSAEESEWIQEKHGAMRASPTLPHCRALQFIGHPGSSRRERGRETKFPRSSYSFPYYNVFLFVRTLFPLGSRSRSLCPPLYYVRFWVDLAKFWKGWSLCSGLILRLIW